MAQFPKTDDVPSPSPVDPSAVYTSPIGGAGANGTDGYITISTPTPSPANWIIDVERWRMASTFGEAPLNKGGMMGAVSSRRTHHAYTWEADILVDFRILSEITIRNYQGRDTKFQVEAYFAWGTPIQYPEIEARYLWVPRLKIATCSPAVECADKKRVRQRIAGVANCHVFLLPDQGTLDAPGTQAGAYKMWLAGHERE